MEISKKQKQIGVAIGVTVGIVGITAIGYYYFRKPELESDELHRGVDEFGNLEQLRPKLTGDSRWRNIDAKYEDLNNYDNRTRRRDSFMVYKRDNDFNENSHSHDVQKRFKILETHGDKGEVVRGTKKLRVSGNVHKPTAGGYNQNNRNPNFNDLIIPIP